MATKVMMPQMGESILEGTITKWLKKVGDTVARDEPLFEISTDKVDSEIPSPASGIVSQILIPEGETVQINTIVAVIDGDSKAAEPEAPPPQPDMVNHKPLAPAEPREQAPLLDILGHTLRHIPSVESAEPLEEGQLPETAAPPALKAIDEVERGGSSCGETETFGFPVQGFSLRTFVHRP